MSEPVIQHVSDTALWVAAYRAIESERKDALFHDPYAGLLAGERGQEIARTMTSSKMTAYSVVVRTRIIDDLIRERLAAGADCILNLGAGLDTRPYRLELPRDLVWIEVDYPHMMELKNERLAGETAKCKLERTAVDLTDQRARETFIAKTAKRFKHIVVLTEGVIPYLSPSEVTTLSKNLTRHASYRYWVLDYYTKAMHRYFRTTKRTQQMGDAGFKFFVGNWRDFFAGLGWRPNEIRYYASEGKKLGRSLPVAWYFKVLIAISTKKQRERSAEMSGYALLARTP